MAHWANGREPSRTTTERGSNPVSRSSLPCAKIHLNTLKMEVERLCQLGVLKKVQLIAMGLRPLS